MNSPRPRLLDLFCGAGGAAAGYARAGFEVTGVDLVNQPRYPFEFIQADALDFPFAGFDAIHASPPCQAYSTLGRMWNAQFEYPDLIAGTRERLRETGLPYVIENVVGSPLINPVTICGSAVGLPLIRRHRLFESNAPIMVPPCSHNQGEKRFPRSTEVKANRAQMIQAGAEALAA